MHINLKACVRERETIKKSGLSTVLAQLSFYFSFWLSAAKTMHSVREGSNLVLERSRADKGGASWQPVKQAETRQHAF